ncbi:MAG: tetratricopeptide repeat protein [Deltaproteobacteria bacterium]|nr:tetratricopeptide repeat protein [Deltaproteobacteria bacterium]
MRRTAVAVLAVLVAAGCSKAQTESIALCNRGVKAYQRGDINLAVSLFDGAIALYPKNEVAHFQLGLILLHERKDLAAAERELSEAAKLNPKDLEVTFQFGRLALARNDFDGALQKFQEVLKGEPGHVGALYWAGVSHHRRGRLNEADELWRKAITADPTYARAYSALAMMYLEAGAESEAMAVLKEAIRVNPEDPECHLNLGVVFLATGNDKAAVDSLTRGIELDPENGTGAFNLANALIRLNRLHEAGYYLKRFIVDGQEKGHDLVEPARRILENLQRLIINEERAKAGG